MTRVSNNTNQTDSSLQNIKGVLSLKLLSQGFHCLVWRTSDLEKTIERTTLRNCDSDHFPECKNVFVGCYYNRGARSLWTSRPRTLPFASQRRTWTLRDSGDHRTLVRAEYAKVLVPCCDWETRPLWTNRTRPRTWTRGANDHVVAPSATTDTGALEVAYDSETPHFSFIPIASSRINNTYEDMYVGTI